MCIRDRNKPYDNSYLNENFNLNMLTPNPDKINLYNTYMKKMILSSSGGKYAVSYTHLKCF